MWPHNQRTAALGVLLKGKQMLSEFSTTGAEFGLMDPRGDHNHLPFDISCPITSLPSSIFKWADAPDFKMPSSVQNVGCSVIIYV